MKESDKISPEIIRDGIHTKAYFYTKDYESDEAAWHACNNHLNSAGAEVYMDHEKNAYFHYVKHWFL